MELVAQFCATSWRSGHGYDSTLNFNIEGHQFELKLIELPTIFAFTDNEFHRPEISTERTIAENELAPLYYHGNEHNFGKNHDLLPEYYIFNNIFHNTLTPKWGDCSSIWGSTRNLLLAILDDQAPPCFSIFFWSELMYVLQHGTQYVIYAPYIQRIINYKAGMEFRYDGKHEAYQSHVVQGPAVPPPPPAATAAGTSAAAPASSPAHAPSPPAMRRLAPSATPESSCAATCQGKKQNILVSGHKTLISMCRPNDALIHESHQQMSQRLSTHLWVLKPLSQSSTHLFLLQLWKTRGLGTATPKEMMTTTMMRAMKTPFFLLLFLVLDAKRGEEDISIYLAIFHIVM
jgi:hypothetical protein